MDTSPTRHCEGCSLQDCGGEFCLHSVPGCTIDAKSHQKHHFIVLVFCCMNNRTFLHVQINYSMKLSISDSKWLAEMTIFILQYAMYQNCNIQVGCYPNDSQWSTQKQRVIPSIMYDNDRGAKMLKCIIFQFCVQVTSLYIEWEIKGLQMRDLVLN